MPIFSKALSSMKQGLTSYRHYGSKSQLMAGSAIHGAEVYAFGRGLGYIHGRYREKAQVAGMPLAGVVGFAAKGLSLLSIMMSPGGGEPYYAAHLDALGEAGLASLGFSQGVSDGTRAAGRKIVMLDPGQSVPAGLKTTDVVGAIPQAVGGAYLSASDLQKLARKGR